MTFLRKIFYPSGKYNELLYGQYIKWSFLSNIISSTEDSISTHCLLSTLGTVNNDIVVSYNYIGKNLIGQIGGLLFVSKFSNTIDKEQKKHFYTSIGLNQFSVYIDCFMPFFKFNSNIFLLLAGGSNIMKNISWIGYGAVNASIIQKLSIDNNISEIYSKISIVNTLASSIGMVCGLSIVYYIPCHQTRLSILPILTLIRFYTIRKSTSGLI
jgi:hypothetical protein